MMDHLLKTAHTFERTHGTAPDVIYINPSHYESLYRHHPELFQPNQDIHLGFRLVIVPSSMLTHPEAALLDITRHLNRVA
ncbi:MAG: hypothetical protein ABFS24_10315 [Pseudomonadota bacterium]